tara:strand:- start:8414 stop:8989 length:576 start_codon:yes stop_codon:yes gene_type:complete
MAQARGKNKDRKRKARRSRQKASFDVYRSKLLNLIRTFDDPILKVKCKDVETKKDLDVIKTLGKVLSNTTDGVGLAASQIGVTKNVIAIRPDIKDGDITFLINPQIIDFIGEEIEVKEGCLSYPGIFCQVQRHSKITVQYLDENMDKQKKTFKDRESVIVQHEMDHTFGICKVGDFWREQKKKKEAVVESK